LKEVCTETKKCRGRMHQEMTYLLDFFQTPYA